MVFTEQLTPRILRSWRIVYNTILKSLKALSTRRASNLHKSKKDRSAGGRCRVSSFNYSPQVNSLGRSESVSPAGLLGERNSAGGPH